MSGILDKETYGKLVEEIVKTMAIPSSLFGRVYKPMEITLPEPERNDFRFTSRMWGIPIYASKFLPTIIVTKVRGIPSAHKPNTRRPFYRKVTTKKTGAYLVNGHGIIAPVGYFASMA